MQLVSHDEKPYCIDCHTSVFAQKCLKCRRAISGKRSLQIATAKLKNSVHLNMPGVLLVVHG